MTHQAFFQSLKARDIARVYLFVGEEEHVKQRALKGLRAALLPEGLEALNETVLDNPAATDIIAAYETLPMMADRRLVTVMDSALLTSGRAKDEANDSALLAERLQNAPDTACVVFYCHTAIDKRKKLSQVLSKHATVVQFDPLEDAELFQWMRAQVKPKAISPQNATLLAFTCGRDLRVLSQELEKLAAYAADQEEITREHIERLATPSLEASIFRFTDAVVDGQEAEAFGLLDRMVEAGESRIGILAMITRQVRNLCHAQLMLGDGKTQAEAQKLLGVPPFAMRKTVTQAGRFAPGALRQAVSLCVETDADIKSGRIREEEALPRVVMTLCDLARGKRGI